MEVCVEVVRMSLYYPEVCPVLSHVLFPTLRRGKDGDREKLPYVTAFASRLKPYTRQFLFIGDIF